MTGRERRLLRMLCMTAGSGGGGGGGDDGGDKPFDELTWDQVIASTKTGKYKTFTVGAMKELDLGTEGIVHMQIVGIDADDLADGSGKAPLTFISKELLATSHRMNPMREGSTGAYTEGTGSIGGWEKCEMRSALRENITPLIPSVVREAIRNVTKYSICYDTAGVLVNNITTTDNIWIPSAREIFGGTSYETSGGDYTDLFDSASARIKDDTNWWLRSSGGTSKNFRLVGPSGNISSVLASNTLKFALGFCL